MGKLSDFFKNNYISILIGVLFYLLYLQFTISGNRICDCESTETYKATSSGSRVGINRFYHK